MIAVYKNGRFQEVPSLIQAAGLSGVKAPVVSAVGGGGKTTALKRLAQEYVRAGKKVVGMTTTHMMAEEEPYFLLKPSVEKIKEILEKYSQVWVGTPSQGGKMKGVPEQFLKEIWAFGLPVLIEADGAKRLPVKAPAEHEPVLLPETTHVLSVYGLDCVGKRIGDITFRAEIAADILRKNIDGRVTPEDIALLAGSERGGRKGCGKGIIYTVVLNKADDDKALENALGICESLEKNGAGRIAVTSYHDTGSGCALWERTHSRPENRLLNKWIGKERQ